MPGLKLQPLKPKHVGSDVRRKGSCEASGCRLRGKPSEDQLQLVDLGCFALIHQNPRSPRNVLLCSPSLCVRGGFLVV